MADRHTKTQRSFNMARVRKFGNASTELRMVRLFRENRIKGWRRHADLPGRPDFAFALERVAVFVDGCFWHGCRRCGLIPATNADYWNPKLLRNALRDKEANRLLKAKGWAVIRCWEHDLKARPGRVMARILRVLNR